MMKILEEIRSQPLWLRELMFAFCVIITVSMVGIYWFNSLERNLVALMNPADQIQESEYAKNNKSFLASMANSLGNLGASVAGFIFPNADTEEKIDQELLLEKKGNIYLLPLSGSK